MSKHNYSQYSKNNKKTENEKTTPVEEIVKVEPVVEVATPAVEVTTHIVEPVETVTALKTVIGVVANCNKLNVRVEPNQTANVACVLDVNSKVNIDLNESTRDWFRICTATGVEGYCMRKFISANL